PRRVIEEEIRYIESCGVEILYNSPIDARHTVDDLMKEGFDAVFIAAGAQASKRIGIPGEDEGLEGLSYGLAFLTDVRMGRHVALKGKTVVLGGGNVAIDVARTATRLALEGDFPVDGASDVQLFCLESRPEMPAWEKEIQEATDEGIAINASWGPRRIISEAGRVTGIEFVRCVSVFDDEGNFKPKFDDSSTQLVDADNILISIGQAPDPSFLSEDLKLERELWGTLAVNDNTLATNIDGVFAGGDFTTGPTYVIRAIASGRRAALAIHQFLQGDADRIRIPDEKTLMAEGAGLALDEETTESVPRAQVALENPRERVRDFREIEKGLTKDQALREATRCLRCDLEKERA
ncbi:MAG TPA: FAD-dependent oxidoreductase, partial [Desulfobacteria bacterium]|nr:FAD-dependent oxidoreductase [Desulfobacteria bacterium]